MAGRNFPADTQKQKFFEDIYNRERDTRIAWFLKVHPQDAEEDESERKKSKQYEVFRKKIQGQHTKPTGKLPPIKEKQFRRTIKNFEHVPDVEDGKIVIEMRPVSQPTKSLLYDGFSKEGKGRHQYLSKRYHIDPEVKYEYPILSSWEYGWRLGDVIKKENIRKPQHGRTRIVADTFYTRTGVPTLQ